MWQDWVVVDPKIMHGRACIRGTRIPVSLILDNLASGVGEAELLSEYPMLSKAAISAALGYAAALARERVVERAA